MRKLRVLFIFCSLFVNTLVADKNKCSYCEKVYKGAHGLAIHLKWYRGESNTFVCKPCHLSFNTICATKKHQAFHDGKLKYKCQNCPFCTDNISNFNRHKNPCYLDELNKLTEEPDNLDMFVSKMVLPGELDTGLFEGITVDLHDLSPIADRFFPDMEPAAKKMAVEKKLKKIKK
jgi:hypothetical protein